MTVWLWLLAGLVMATLNAASIAGTVGRLRPEAGCPPAPALFLIAGGFVVRLTLSALVLVVALQQSSAAGLLAFAGLWLGRWTVLLWTNAPVRCCKTRA